MSTLTQERETVSRGRNEIGGPPKPPPRPGWAIVVLLALAVGAVFCHGCHRGDHDDEPALIWLKQRPRE